MLSSAASIIIEAELTSLSTGPFYRDLVTPLRHDKRPVRALGGQGGAGREDRCGASVTGESGWRFDAIPFEAFEGREDIPPYTPPNLSNTFSLCNEIASCAVGTVPEGTVIGGGGDGSPGLIQLHVADPDTQLSFGGAGATGYVTAGLDVSRSMVPPPVGWRTPTDRPDTLVPFFAGQSESFSRWIPLGLARVNADGSANPVEFFFRGTDVDGSVLRDGEEAAALAPAMPYTPLSVGGTAPSIQTSTALLRLPEASVADPNDLYRRNPTLLREFEVRFRSSGAPSDDRRYTVMAASFDAVAAEYTLALDPMGLALGADIAHLQSQPGDLEVELIPFDFRLLTSGERDRFPAGTEVRIKFDATVAQPQTGQPSPDPELSFSGRVDVAGMDLAVKNGYAEQIDALNGQVAAPGQTDILNLMLETVNWDFVRFKVEFEVPTTLGSELPGVDLLRIPFRF